MKFKYSLGWVGAAALILLAFQNCGPGFKTFINNSVAKLPFQSSEFSSITTAFSIEVAADELKAGSQVQWLGMFPTTTLSNENLDPDRFKMLIQELQGRSNMISISYISEEAMALGYSKGMVSRRKLSALALLDEKIAAAEALGFSASIELTPVFFNYDPTTLRLDLSKFKDNYQAEWAEVVKVIKKHSNVNWFYPFDEPYWNAKTAKISYPVMKSYLDKINGMIKTEFPNSKIAFVEAFAVMNENFEIPVHTDYVGMDCYGNFDNCYGESIPSYYNKLAAKMTSNQKFILIPDAFDFKGGDENGAWQNNVIEQSKKFLAFSRQNPRVEAIFFFLYNAPLDKPLNIENLAGTRQGSLLNLYFDQVSLQNQSLLGPSPVLNPEISISYLDQNSDVVHIQTSEQNSAIVISPKAFFDMSFIRPVVAAAQIECGVIDPAGGHQNCNEIVYRQARYKMQDLKKGQWTFQFTVNGAPRVERRVTVVDSLPEPSLSISCPRSVVVGSEASCTATANVGLASGYWTVNGNKQIDSSKYTYTWSDIPGPALYKVQGFATDIYGRSISSNIIAVSAVSPEVAIQCTVYDNGAVNVTCVASANGKIKSTFWRVNGVKQAGSDNLLTYTWYNVAKGIYTGDLVARDSSDNEVISKTVTIQVN